MPLAVSAQEKGSAVERLHRWLERLITLKRQKVLDEPELFATYHAIAFQGARGGSRFLYKYDYALVP